MKRSSPSSSSAEPYQACRGSGLKETSQNDWNGSEALFLNVVQDITTE